MKTNKSFLKKIVSVMILMLLTNNVIPRYTAISLEIRTGNASYYAKKFNGRITASGEKFNSNDYTCAHKTLPFNTFLKVTNLGNNKSVIVRVNDRGPYVRGRIVDLSTIAAKEIKMMGNGTAKVSIEILGAAKEETDQNHSSPSNEMEKYSFED